MAAPNRSRSAIGIAAAVTAAVAGGVGALFLALPAGGAAPADPEPVLAEQEPAGDETPTQVTPTIEVIDATGRPLAVTTAGGPADTPPTPVPAATHDHYSEMEDDEDHADEMEGADEHADEMEGADEHADEHADEMEGDEDHADEHADEMDHDDVHAEDDGG